MSSDPNLPPGYDPNPLPPSSSPVPPLPGDASATSTGLAPNVAAGLSAIFSLLGGIVFILLEKRNQFVRFWAMQSIFFGAFGFIYSIVSRVITAVLIHIPLVGTLWVLLSLLISLVFLAVWIITIVKAFSGKVWEIPVLGKLARQQLGQTPPV